MTDDGSAAPGRTLITTPVDLAPEESMLVSRIKNSLPTTESKALFEVILPYLDGDHAFETIAARTGSKRASVEECLESLDRKGLLVVVRILDGLVSPCAEP
jgi:hypothetical protein